MMVWVMCFVASFGAFGIGIKGFTADGLTLSGDERLKGSAGRTVGTFCILLGIGLQALGIAGSLGLLYQ